MTSQALETHVFRKLGFVSHSTLDASSLLESTSIRISSGSTIRDIGSPTSKAVQALENVALRGLDRVTIYVRLRAVLPKFPHTDAEASAIAGIQEAYDMILQLSKPGSYGGSIKRTVWNLLLRQINCGYTHELEQALDRCDIVELEIFLDSLKEHSRASKSRKNNPIVNNFPFGSAYPMIIEPETMIMFMCRMVQKSEQGCQGVLNVGFYRLLASTGEESFSEYKLSEIYRTILFISTRSEQFNTSRKEAMQFLARCISPLRPLFIKTLELWNVDDLKSLVDLVLGNTAPLGDSLPYDVALSTLTLLFHIGNNSAQGKRKMFGAGYLDILLRLETL